VNFMVYGGYSFSYPESLLSSKPPPLPVVYAIAILNLAWKPLPYEPIYFGESEDLTRETLPFHAAFERWSAHPAVRDGGRLYVSYLWLPRRTADFREHVERTLIATYRPACNWMSRDSTRVLLASSPR
jgi:hypothetical protein